MSQCKFKAPTPRRRQPPKQAPFPVPISTISGQPPSGENWNYYVGRLVGNAVVVSHSGDIESLYKMGCFGKASLSRFRPEYNHGYKGISRRGRHLHTTEEVLRVTSRRKYMRHLHWKQLEEGTSKISADEDLEILPLPEVRNRTHDPPMIGDIAMATEDSNKMADPSETSGRLADSDPLANESEGKFETRDAVKSPDPLTTFDPWENTEADPWAEDDPSASAQFWLTTETNTSWSQGDSWNMEKIAKSKDEEKIISENKEIELNAGEMPPAALNDVKNRGMEDDMKSEGAKEQRTKKRRRERKVENNQPEMDRPTDGKVETEDREEESPQKKHKGIDEDLKNLKLSEGIQADSDSVCEDDQDMEKPMIFDERSLEDDPNARLLAVEDSDCEEEDWNIPNRLPWRPVAKQDPYPLQEQLYLSLEEAFFLSFALGCLIITDENEVPLNISELWRRFMQCRPLFPYKYAVYHNFRSKGWVPKQGFKYGVDYVVYKEGPAYFHSSFCAQIRVVDEESLEEIKELNERKLSWSVLAGLNRVTEQVAKEVMLCYVLKPPTLTDEQLQSPNCLKSLKIQETILQRWISSQERESSEETIS